MPEMLTSPRPPYEVTFTMYGPDPDCYNRDRHIRYLTKLKNQPVQGDDDKESYDSAIDQYVRRLQYYCR